MKFIITKTGNSIKNLNISLPIAGENTDYKFKFRMFDADGFLYFEGLSKISKSFIPLDEFGYSYGCTGIHYFKNNSYQRL